MHDVFVSYAHIDNEPLPGIKHGWVTNFVEGLKITLAKEMGRKDKFSLWMDYEKLRGNHTVTPEIHSVLAEARTLVLFLSKSYLESSWCMDEFNTFAARPEAGGGGRIFAVYVAPVEEEPDVLQDLLNYKLWVEDDGGHRTLGDPQPDPTEHRYYDQLRALSRDLAETLSGIQKPKLPSNVVFVNGGEQDVELMRATAEELRLAGMAHTLPVTAIAGFDAADISPTEVTRDLQENLMRCDAMLLVQEKAPTIQIRQHVTEYLKTKARREHPPRLIAVCQTDPAKQALGLHVAEMRILSVNNPFDQCCADCLIKALAE